MTWVKEAWWPERKAYPMLLIRCCLSGQAELCCWCPLPALPTVQQAPGRACPSDLSLLPNSFGSNGCEIIGLISLTRSLLNARYKSKLIPKMPFNLSQLKTQAYQDSNLKRFAFYGKEPHYKFWIFSLPLTFPVKQRRQKFCSILFIHIAYFVSRPFYLTLWVVNIYKTTQKS